MGLTKQSIGMGAVDFGLEIKKQTPDDKIIAITGNPSVGKSTLLNDLTEMNQHIGNWPGKTVTSAQGYCKTREHSYVLVDIPGTYSLVAHSTEEKVVHDFICFDGSDGVVVVRDATCLGRNLNLVLRTTEISDRVLACANLMDEAVRKNIAIDLEGLSEKLGVPVAGTIARKKQSLDQLVKQLGGLVEGTQTASPYQVEHSPIIEQATAMVEPAVKGRVEGKVNSRWLILKLLDSDPSLMKELREYLDEDILEVPEISLALSQAREHLAKYGITNEILKDRIMAALVASTERIYRDTVQFHRNGYNEGDRELDKILTSRFTGYPVMIGMLVVVFWLTITGVSYPSQMLADALFRFQDQLTKAFMAVGAPPWLHGLLILGVYRTLAWVVSVMLPPMAIFFPLLTLLEDSGYLPRVTYSLDKPLKSYHACGKQVLTMCMGFGCNAAGIVGYRIIDSPRERLIAVTTNNFVPCNRRFPTLIAIISMLFVGVSGDAFDSMLSALSLTLFIVLGVCMTFAVSKVLSMTVLKGIPSSFTLELSLYQRPQIDKVIIRSAFDQALFVLGRAIAVAAPAGLLIWIMANMQLDDIILLAHFSGFLDPFARLFGMDGVILMAFILGLLANEIVIPIIIMAYMAQRSLLELDSLAQLRDLLVNNGWTRITAISTMLFSLMHWPCTTTLLTIRKEPGSLKWTAMPFLVPTVCGIVPYFVSATVARISV